MTDAFARQGGMTGKEQHLRPPPSLTSTYYCCNSRSTSPLARIVLAGHKALGKPMDRAFVASLDCITLQWLCVILSRVQLPRALPLPTASVNIVP